MRCLVITPKRFYIFHTFLAQALEDRGYEVSILNEEYPENILGVLLGNFIPFISKWLTLNFLRKYLTEKRRYDVAIIIKGRGMSLEAINYLKGHTERIIGYNFDSFGYNSSPLKWMKGVDKYATFDHRDALDYGLEKIELFASVEKMEETEKKTDLSAILKNHSDRLLYLDQLSCLFPRISTEIFIYERNLLTFLRNFISHPLLMIKWWKFISFSPLDYSTYLDIINKSKYTLDFAHPKQTGTTIRCFEALACKTKIISNNKYILTNPVFNKNCVIIHPLHGDVEKLYQQMQEKKEFKIESNPRSINDFVDELLS